MTFQGKSTISCNITASANDEAANNLSAGVVLASTSLLVLLAVLVSMLPHSMLVYLASHCLAVTSSQAISQMDTVELSLLVKVRHD